MLHINKGQSNTIYVTANEKVTLTNPVFLFVFFSQMTKETVSFILANESLHTSRYDQFTFTEGGSKTLAVGKHYYTIYAQESADNTDPDLADEEVERGIATVYTTENTFVSNTITQTYKQNVI